MSKARLFNAGAGIPVIRSGRNHPDGTAAAPGAVGVGDIDTGLFWPGGNVLGFATGGVEAARFTGSQQLLIGDTAARNLRLGGLLEIVVSGQAPAGHVSLVSYSTDVDGAAMLELGRSKSATKGVHTVLSNADVIGIVNFRGSDGAAFQDAGSFRSAVDGTPVAGFVPNALLFFTGTASVAPAERWRITSGGVLRSANALWQASRNAGDTADINLQRLDASNRHELDLNSLSWVLTNALTQTTVGAAGAASALPANPTGYLRVLIAGAERVIPFYAQA